MYDVIIIGGGAAGLFIAANLKGENNLLIEGTKKLGQKILISGGGMCNITNQDSVEKFLTRFGDKKKANFLKPALLNFTPKDTITWLNDKDLDTVIRDDGKVFPKSLKAQSIIDTLQKSGRDNGMIFKFNSKITKVSKTDDFFEISTSSENYRCKKLIITTGGKSFPNTGSDGSGYLFAKKLGHNIIEPTQGLVNVKTKDYPFSTLSGTSTKNSLVDFFHSGENKRYLQSNGDLLFTHQGLSGPVILNNSRVIKNNDTLQVSLISCNNKEEKKTELLKILSTKKSVKKTLKELGLTNSTITALSAQLSIPIDTIVNQLNKKLKNKLIDSLLNYKFTVSQKGGFNSAMVTVGGVDISEINRKTMESKLVPNLYFAGEILDIDGDTGGYNIQAAFSTGMLVANTILK